MSKKINILKQPETNITAYVGQSLVLAVHVSTLDFKDYTIEWKLNGVNVPADKISDNWDLFVPTVGENDFGVYTARVKLVGEPTEFVDIKPVHVSRIYWIRPVSQPFTHIKKRIGEALNLTVVAEAESPHQPAYAWYKDGQLLGDDVLTNDTFVNIPRISKKDFGVYTCRAFIRDHGQAFYLIDPIYVEENTDEPVIHMQEDYQENVTVLEDLPLTLNVTVTSDDKVTPITYTWIHDGHTAVDQDYSAVMRIPNITQDHEGAWRLEVKQGNTTVYSKDCHISVEGRAFFRISKQPLNLQLQAGASGQLSTDYATSYDGVSMQWFRKKSGETEWSKIVGATGKVLPIIPATTELNNAHYKVRFTYAGHDTDSDEAILLVGEAIAITITQQPQSITNARVSSSKSLTCKAELNYPHYKLDYQWFKDNQLIPGKTSSVLHFSSIAKSDEGTYKCVVSTGIQNHRVAKSTNDVTVSVDDSKSTITINKQPKAVKVRSGAAWIVYVEAVTNDALPIRYRWFKDGEDLFPPGTEQKNFHGEDHAQPLSTGVYSCKLSAGFGDHRVSKTTDSVRVIISDDATIVPNDLAVVIHPQDQRVNYNGQVMLHAKATNTIGLDPHYQWYKDGVKIDGQTSETLIIPHAKPSDVGAYTAKITVAERTVETNPAQITMEPHSNLTITKHPFDVVAKEGDGAQDIVLYAEAEHLDDTKVVSWQWHKIQNGVDTEIQGATERRYTIPKSQVNKVQHQATYYAVATDDQGHRMNTEKIKVVFTTAKLKRYVHPIPWRGTSFQYQGYWVMDEIERCNKVGLNWLENFEHTRYPDEIETIAASLNVYSNTHILESRNGYLVDGTQLF